MEFSYHLHKCLTGTEALIEISFTRIFHSFQTHLTVWNLNHMITGSRPPPPIWSFVIMLSATRWSCDDNWAISMTTEQIVPGDEYCELHLHVRRTSKYRNFLLPVGGALTMIQNSSIVFMTWTIIKFWRDMRMWSEVTTAFSVSLKHWNTPRHHGDTLWQNSQFSQYSILYILWPSCRIWSSL